MARFARLCVKFVVLALLAGFFLCAPAPLNQPIAQAAPVTNHPRLWLTQDDLPRLRSWAVASNPMYSQGLLVAYNQALINYNTKFFPNDQPNPVWPDKGGLTWEAYATEAYAEFFAFMSLVNPDSDARAQGAQRARRLLMYVMDEAAKGQANAPFRWPQFNLQLRSNAWGEAFPLTVDWIYPHLSAQDKATIRTVFLRWADENLNASVSGGDHPQPVGVMNDPQLLDNSHKLRVAANNFYSGHMRELTMLALALDAADDPPVDPNQPENKLGNTLRSYIANATGAWLYQQYATYEEPAIVSAAYGIPTAGLGAARGGLSPEGFLYDISLGSIFGGLFSLHTAGYNDTALSGPQMAFIDSAYWDKLLDGYLHTVAPVPVNYTYHGEVYPLANYGDTLRAWFIPEHIKTLGVMGLYDGSVGNDARLQKVRWMAANLLEGGGAKLYARAGQIWGNSQATNAILYFMLFDPDAPTPPDPRPALPTTFYSEGIGRLLARTDWTPDASWFNYLCQWNAINHQHGNCNQFEFYRKGEWLTKERSNYSNDFIGGLPEYHNSLALQNDVPPKLGWFEGPISARGGQWREKQAAGDPTVTVSFASAYAFAQADATNLYNRVNNTASDILHASRSILWLKPDQIVIYDRATSKTANRFKRFNLNLLTSPVVSGTTAVATTALGQQLVVNALLPLAATLTITDAENFRDVADMETTRFRLVIEDPGNPTDICFLTVLEGLDAGATPSAVQHLQSSGGTPFEGVLVGNTAILFAVEMAAPFASLIYAIPSTVTAQLITGLAPGGGYDVSSQRSGGQISVTLAPGTAYHADSGGVLALGALESVTHSVYLPGLWR
jgi:hypothetical protein